MAKLKDPGTWGPGLRLGMQVGDTLIIDGEIEIQLVHGSARSRVRVYDPKRRSIHRKNYKKSYATPADASESED